MKKVSAGRLRVALAPSNSIGQLDLVPAINKELRPNGGFPYICEFTLPTHCRRSSRRRFNGSYQSRAVTWCTCPQTAALPLRSLVGLESSDRYFVLTRRKLSSREAACRFRNGRT